MGRIDPNLRTLLDSLSVEKGVRHPTENMDILRSIVDRIAPHGADEPTDHGYADAPQTRGHHGHDPALEEELRRTQAERDELARRYAELEDRIHHVADDETSGGLSFVDDDPYAADDEGEPLPEAPEYEPEVPTPESEVRFQRIDAAPPVPTVAPLSADDFDALDDDGAFDDIYGVPDEELMEFEGLAAAPPANDWDDGAWGADAEAHEDAWSDDDYAESTGAHEDSPAPAASGTPPATSDDELAELERQLAELEADLEALGGDDEDDEA